MINYAVVGAGWISQIAFLPGVAQSGNSRVSAIVTGDRTKAAQLAEFHGVDTIVGYDDYDTLLASSKIDAVYIALPNDMHADFAIRAARAGRHVMVEKPLAVNEDESLAIIAAARKANVFLMVAYRLHNEPGTVAVLEHIRAGAIGRPLYFQSAFSFQMASVNHRPAMTAWGGPLHRTSEFIVSTPPDMFLGGADRGRGGVAPTEERRAVQRSGRDRGRHSAISIRRPCAIRRKFRRRGDRQLSRVGTAMGDLELNPGYRFETATKLYSRRDGKTVETAFPQTDHFGAQVAYFSDCIERVEPPPEADGEEGLADGVRALASAICAFALPVYLRRLPRRPVPITRPRTWCGSHDRPIGYFSFCDTLAIVSVSTRASKPLFTSNAQ